MQFLGLDHFAGHVGETFTVALDHDGNAPFALVEARPRTGRLHQIRRHCKHIACPLIGDVRYGKGEHNRLFRARFGDSPRGVRSAGKA